MTGSDFKINNFDLLRIFAATQVVFGHGLVHLNIEKPVWWWVVNAFPGVPIFFVISGFLISASFERSSSVVTYGRNRILRIAPGLWCVVLITIGVAAAFGFNFLNGSAAVWLLAQFSGVIYTPHFLAGFGFGSYNGSLWTIPIELQFYFLLPAIYWLSRKSDHRTTYIAILWAIFTIIALMVSYVFPPISEVPQEPILRKLLRYSFVPHVYLFLTGILLQRTAVYRSPWIAGKGIYWLVLYLAYEFLISYSAGTYVLGMLLLGITTVSLAYTAPRLSDRILRGNDISYGVYIYHGLIINVFVELGLGGQMRHLQYLVALAYVSGYLSWILVERPFLRRKRQSIHPAPPAT